MYYVMPVAVRVQNASADVQLYHDSVIGCKITNEWVHVINLVPGTVLNLVSSTA